MEQLEPQPQLPKKHLWVDYVEEDHEEELGVGLLARFSRHSTNGVGTTPTSTTTSSSELEPVPASVPTNGTSSEHFNQEEEEEEATADDCHRNEEVGDENEEDKVVKGEGDGIGYSVYFDKLQGTESINEFSEMQSEIPKILSMEVNHQRVKNVEDQNFFGLNPAPVEQLYIETNTSFKHFDNATKVDAKVDLIGEIEEDLVELDVEKVLENQKTHDLYCPNCNSCITRRVILRRRKPQFSNICRKPKHVKRLDPIPNSVGDGRGGDTPEIYSNVSPTTALDEQNNGTEQDQEAFNCLSCFSLFIPIAGHASTVQSATVPTSSVTSREHIDGAAIKPKEPGISNIFSSTNSSQLDKVKAEFREEEADADMFQRNAGDNEIEDIEAGLLESTLYPRTEVVTSAQSRTQTEHRGIDDGEAHEWEILKSIVYGGLIESITSLCVVSSAAGAGGDTLNVLALGLANLIGGVIIISHNLRELKNDQPRGVSAEINIEEDRYQVLLGQRQNFALHVTVAILSFLIFGLVPPVVYGFSFRKSDDKDLKLAAVAGTSLVCIILLALGKVHVRKAHRTYFRTVSYYVVLGIMASGISYLVGELIKKLLDQLGLFESSSAFSMPFLETIPLEVGRASY